MPFKLLLSEETSPALRRIMLEQLAKTRREISASQNLQNGVHEARKCLKRMRALLRLIRPIIGDELYRTENRNYREIARKLARPREAGALLEAVDRFEKREDFARFRPFLAKTKALILKEKYSSESELEVVVLGAIIEQLDEATLLWREISLPASNFKDLAQGFAVSYERGQVSLKKAMRKNRSPYWHEWRKDVQKTWHHLQIFMLIWPEDITPRLQLAKDISKLLGAEHDLAELRRFIKAHKGEFKKQADIKSLRKPFAMALSGLQRDLCTHAIERGRRLYAFEPHSLANAMAVYWQTGQALQPMPSIVREIADIKALQNDKLIEMRSLRRQAETSKKGGQSGG